MSALAQRQAFAELMADFVVPYGDALSQSRVLLRFKTLALLATMSRIFRRPFEEHVVCVCV